MNLGWQVKNNWKLILMRLTQKKNHRYGKFWIMFLEFLLSSLLPTSWQKWKKANKDIQEAVVFLTRKKEECLAHKEVEDLVKEVVLEEAEVVD